MANSKDMLLAALSCVTQGSAPKGRYEALNRGTANLVLQGAVEELLDLRAELRELYCRACGVKYSGNINEQVCPKCKGQLVSLAHAQLKALRRQVLSLEDRVERLELTIKTLSDLSD